MRLELVEATSPLGSYVAAHREDRLVALTLADAWPRLARKLERNVPGLACVRIVGSTATTRAMEGYFGGQLDALDALDVDPIGTEFQKRVWSALRDIRVGSVTSYHTLAAGIGQPRATRAVAAANAANPIWIVIPCHRVIGSEGRLCGYGGGLERKAWLLRHEGLYVDADPPSATATTMVKIAAPSEVSFGREAPFSGANAELS